MGLFGLPGGNKNGETAARAHRESSNGAKFFRYTHMPEIMPRLRAIGGKLGHFAYMLALIFRSTRLLPANHPMINPVNIGRFGITDVIATAANGLVLKRENMDQILVFGAVVMAMLMIAVQVVVIFAYSFLGSAQASSGSMFSTASPQSDLVMQFLGQVFGFQSIFGHPAAVDQPAFYAILGFYSTAMMVFAVMIVVYYVITVVGESAQTGQPFGKRFNGLWAPIRLVLALGLLVPLGGGINAAQYLTLYIAKFGSGLASQGWIRFTDTIGRPDNIISSLSAPSAQNLASQIFAAEACRGAYNQAHRNGANQVNIRVNAGRRSAIAQFSQNDIDFAKQQRASSVTYVWTTQGVNSQGAAESLCGSLSMPIVTSTSGINGNSTMNLADTLASNMQNGYVQAIGAMIISISGSTNAVMPNSLTHRYVNQTMTINQGGGSSAFMTNTDPAVRDGILTELALAVDQMQSSMNASVRTVNTALAGRNPTIDNIQQQMRTDASSRGWGTAGVYYLEIAKFTQMVLDAVSGSEPKQVSSPNGQVDGRNLWSRITLRGDPNEPVNVQIATVLENVDSTFTAAAGQTNTAPSISAAEPSIDASHYWTDPLLGMAALMFGKSFFLMFDTPTLNPMGKLIEGGKSILDRVKWFVWLYVGSQVGAVASTVVGLAAGGPAGGGAAFVVSTLLKAVGGLLWPLMIVGAAVGIVLFYLLPLLPFMYFFFSVVNWVIEVAEAFISMPLFALSHLRIDGEGLFPQRALDNWITLFGILLRPLLIVIGMIVGSLVFNAGAFYLASIFKYAIFSYNSGANLTSSGVDFSKISAFGIITYVVLYVYMIYMLATSSFKLIDQIPDKMLRWIGGPTPFTGDRPVDLGQMQSVALMGYGAIQTVGKGIDQFSDGLGKAREGMKGRPAAGSKGATGGGGAP